MARGSSDEDKEIIRLYVTEHYSMQQIADTFNVSLNKIVYRLDKHSIERRNLSEAIRYLNLVKHQKGDFHVKSKLTNSEEKLKVAGTMLYWGEGTKTGGSVALCNSDPRIIILYLKFLREICGVSEKRLRIGLHIYPDHKAEKLIRYWSTVTGIPKKQFNVPYVHVGRRGTYKRLSKYGTVAVRYSDKKLLATINSWISEYNSIL